LDRINFKEKHNYKIDIKKGKSEDDIIIIKRGLIEDKDKNNGYNFNDDINNCKFD
jgi:hypothetical protein